MVTLKAIKDNKGMTLDTNGDAVAFRTGFQVSKCDLAVIPVYRLCKYQIIEALNWVNDNDHLGIWIDNGKAYIDISERVSNLKHALKVGRERKQLSVWAWAKNKAVAC